MNYITLKQTATEILLLVLSSLLAIHFAYAFADHDVTVSEALDQIVTTQDVTDERGIECDMVSNEHLELLGDALMQRMIGDEELHTQMDNMMGGEDSETLTAMHRHLARTYLGCSDSGFGMGMMMGGGMMQSMMGGGPMGMMGSQGFDFTQRSAFNNDSTFGSMMGFNTMGLGFGGLGGIILIAFWVLVIVGIVLLIQKLMSRDTMREHDRHTDKNALEILKVRYAKGEIDQKEFEQKKKDLI